MDEASHSLDRIAAANERLLATATALSDAQARGPSLLPGWTRGHVLTHIARNSGGLVNLLTWARSGVETPMYASPESRAADIEAGAGRPAADLFADVRNSAETFAVAAAAMPGDAWTAPVRMLYGPAFPALGVLARRLSEVEIHHVDLGAGYTHHDWPADFVADALPRVAGSFTGRDHTPRCLVWADGASRGYLIGPAGEGNPRVVVRGDPADLLAWLTGRSDGATLTTASGGLVPELPPWG